MKNLYYIFFTCVITIGFASTAHAQVYQKPVTLEAEPWQESQLLTPAALAAQLKSNDSRAVILNIGTGADIKDARHIGPASDNDNIEKLKKAVASLSKDTPLIIYCGCCPLHTKCPNAKPAFNELTRLGFTNIQVLDLATNLKTDWAAKGYPMAGK